MKGWCPKPIDEPSKNLVPQVGLEPTRISALASKTSVATITPPGQKTVLNKRMSTANVNLGIEALLTYASTDTYREKGSWTTSRDFKPAEWWQRLDSNQPHTDFQSAALPDELRRQ